jgi:hypothetical protein
MIRQRTRVVKRHPEGDWLAETRRSACAPSAASGGCRGEDRSARTLLCVANRDYRLLHTFVADVSAVASDSRVIASLAVILSHVIVFFRLRRF